MRRRRGPAVDAGPRRPPTDVIRVRRKAGGIADDRSPSKEEVRMPLTTVARGRVFDWSHAVGRGAARGNGFNYIQTMCLDKDGVLYTTNRGSENNFGMHCNKVKLGGPGEEEWLADFCEYGEGDGHCIWPFGIAVDSQGQIYVSDEWTNTISVFDGDGKFVGKCGRAGKGEGEFNQPWGVTLDKAGDILVADWKNHRIQKLSPHGRFLSSIGSYGKIEEPDNAYRVTIFGPYVAGEGEKAGHPRTDQFNHPTDVAVDSDGDIYVADWGNHRVCIFDSEGGPITTLVGDAQVLSKWGQMSIDENPDMAKARRRVKSLEPQWRFCF